MIFAGRTRRSQMNLPHLARWDINFTFGHQWAIVRSDCRSREEFRCGEIVTAISDIRQTENVIMTMIEDDRLRSEAEIGELDANHCWRLRGRGLRAKKDERWCKQGSETHGCCSFRRLNA